MDIEKRPNTSVRSIDWERLTREISYETARSGGPGGQNVNKRDTKVTARWSVVRSKALPEEIENRILAACENKITSRGELLVSSEKFRTQPENRADATQKLLKLIRAAAKPVVKRRRKPVPKGLKEKRLEGKRKLSAKKASRRTKSEE